MENTINQKNQIIKALQEAILEELKEMKLEVNFRTQRIKTLYAKLKQHEKE